MVTLLELRTNLASKGYQETASSTEQRLVAPLITIHTHPLLSSPVVLIGNNLDTALTYQSDMVNTAIKRR